jgi:hypothetical protein
MNLKLKARINRSDARTIQYALGQLSAKGSVRKAGDEFVGEAEMEGANAKEQAHILLLAASMKGSKAADNFLKSSYAERCE